MANGDNSPSGEKKKVVRKVVKRTVSVKRTTVAPSFGDGPPDDGQEYIKICGKWVRMKGKEKSIPQHDVGNSPPPKAEWGKGIDLSKYSTNYLCSLY